MSNLIKISIWLAVITTMALTGASPCRAAAAPPCDSLKVSLYFRNNNDLLMRHYRGNQDALARIDSIINNTPLHHISAIRIVGSASPEGNDKKNQELARLRANALKVYIRWQHPHIAQMAPEIIQSSYNVNFLPEWIYAAEQDHRLPRRDRVLRILRSPASLATKLANIQLLTGGAAEYMKREIFPYLRNATSCVFFFSRTPDTTAEETAQLPAEDAAEMPTTQSAELPAVQLADSVTSSEAMVTDTVQSAQAPTTTPASIEHGFVRKPLLALKTNLLFDAATLLNVEVEVPIGKRWSIAAEWMFPWWLWEQKQRALQVMSGNIEGRYWLGNRDFKANGDARPKMTGWFLGLYAGGGYYDLEWNRTGYQGEFFIAAGISAGYAHAINKRGNLRMEYSLGIGYMQTNYRKYEAKIGTDNEWHLYRRESGKYTWIGPTRAKVSLVWLLDFKRKGGLR